MEGRFGYRYPVSHYSSPNQGERGRLLTFQKIILVVMGDLDICTRPGTITPRGEIVGVKLQDMEVGLKISTTLPS